MTLEHGISARASVPSGASTGKFEAVELRDGRERYFGLGVQQAVCNVNDKIAKELIGKNALQQLEIDSLLIQLDGTENKEHLGANAILSGSRKSGGSGASDAALPLSGRKLYEKTAGADDEYPKRRKTREQQCGFSGIYDHAGRS